MSERLAALDAFSKSTPGVGNGKQAWTGGAYGWRGAASLDHARTNCRL
jgi:hypothetical protein